jgi:hypothetical protein
LSVADLENKWMAFPPLGRGRAHAALRYVNFDGFVVLPGRHPQEAIHAYAQVFRSGIVEAVSTVDRGDGAVLAATLDKYSVASTKTYVDALAQCGVGFPVAVLASLLGVKGRSLESGIDGLYPPYGEQQIDRDQLHFSECILELAPHNYAECAVSLRGLLEQIWNTAGYADQQTIRNDGWMFGT